MDKTLGMVFAMATADEQSGMLNAAGTMMKKAFGGDMYVDIQCCRIAEGLNMDGKEMIRKIMMFIEEK